MIKMKIGKKLAEERELRKLNQAEMADLLGVPPATYSRIERGVTSVDLEDVMRFSKNLDIPIQEFLPETINFNHSNNENGTVGLLIGNFYHYNDVNSQVLQLQNEIEKLNLRIEFLEKENAHQQKIIALLEGK